VFRFAFLAVAAFVCTISYGQPSTPVILISVDTLRADHLSCYQPGRKLTPHIDSLAKNGTLFSQVNSPYPLTLPAHVALFTSTYPFTNGVQDNGVPLNASPATLATELKSAGYRTGAFVGSFILDRRFGLARGFDVYDGPLDLHKKTENGAIERKRPGAQVAEAAKRWVEQNKNAPFFLFLHLYDLHLPYDLPGGYSGELAYIDHVLGDFFDFLQRRGLMEKSLVVFTSDHGEGLGDHGESTHGYFIYQSTLHVPLIVHWPTNSRRIPQDRVDEPAGLLDVTPTILESLGIRAPAGMKGRSLIGAGGEREVYSESIYARSHFGCASLRSIRAGRYKYIEAPKPELYDLASDPKELHNLYEQQRPKAAQLSGHIAAIRASSPSPAPAKPTAENAVALRSLGYLGGPASTGRESRVDPKDRIADFQRYFDAVWLATGGRLAESTRVLENLRDKLPDIAEIRTSLGINLKRLGRYPEATRELQRATELAPSDAQAHYELGSCYVQLRETYQAIAAFNAALAVEPWYTMADESLAEIYVQKQDFAQARARLNHLLSVDPRSYIANYNLGVMAAMEKNWSEAEQRMLAALAADPNSAEAHNTLGGIYFERGDLQKARQQFEHAVRLEPKLGSAHYHLALILQKEGKAAEAGQEFRAAQQSER
jgi:arylsulfatase A-like enzyme/Flp pilus assembly protein TadD